MADVTIEGGMGGVAHRDGGSRQYVWVNTNDGFHIYRNADQKLFYIRTDDGGATWQIKVEISQKKIRRFDVWYDKWTDGDTGDNINIVYLNDDDSQCIFRTLDVSTPSSPSLGSEVIAASSIGTMVSDTLAEAKCSLTKARGGNFYIQYTTATDSDFLRSTDSGSSFGSRDDPQESIDHILLYPANLADNQDIWALYWDGSANAITVKTYDDSANTFTTEDSVDSSMVDDTQNYLNMTGAVRHSDGNLLIAAWSELDTSTADLRTFDYDGSSSTTTTEVISNTAEAATCSITINQQNDDVYVGYVIGGTWASTVDVAYKLSTDGMSNWGSENTFQESGAGDTRHINADISIGDDGGRIQWSWGDDDETKLLTNNVNSIEIAAAGAVARTLFSGPIPQPII